MLADKLFDLLLKMLDGFLGHARRSHTPISPSTPPLNGYNGDVVRVALPGARSHRVRIVDEGGVWRAESTVSRRGVELSPPELRLFAWRRNRAVDLVGFRVDEKERVFGEARIPKAGTSVGEFRLVLDAVAFESDRFEFALTGRDIE